LYAVGEGRFAQTPSAASPRPIRFDPKNVLRRGARQGGLTRLSLRLSLSPQRSCYGRPRDSWQPVGVYRSAHTPAAATIIASLLLVSQSRLHPTATGPQGRAPECSFRIPDNGDYHDDGRDDPAERHPQTAAHDPCYVEEKGEDGHSPAPH